MRYSKRRRIKKPDPKNQPMTREQTYRMFMIFFVAQTFVLMLLIPNIFDSLWPAGMKELRNIASWMLLSAAGVFLPIPGGSPSDYAFIGLLIKGTSNANAFYVGTIIVMADTIFAFFAYKFANTLIKIFGSKKSNTDDINENLKKYGNLTVLVGSATPLPFTLMLYAAGALKLPIKGFLVAVFLGRTVKYLAIGVPLQLFNFNLVTYGEKLWSNLLIGKLGVVHYLIFALILGLIIYILIKVLKYLKKVEIK